MGGFDASAAFALKEHNCGKSSTLAKADRDRLLKIVDEFYKPETEDLKVLAQRLDQVILALHATELWKVYTPAEPLVREDAWEKMNPFFQGEDEAPCAGCFAGRLFYASGLMMLIEAVAEAFSIPMRVKQTADEEELCEKALERIEKEMDTIINIGMHADELAYY